MMCPLGTSRGPGRPRLTDAQKADQREAALAAARRAIQAHGADVSLAEVALEAGISKPALYAAIGGRAAIAEALAVELIDAEAAPVIAALSAGGTPVEALRRALTSLMDFAQTEPELYGFIVRSLHAAEQGVLDHPLFVALHERVLSLRGAIAPQFDAQLLSVLTHGVLAFIFGAIESWQQTQQPAPEHVVDAMTAMAVAAFTAVVATPPPAMK